VSRALDVVTLTGEEYDAMQEAIERLRELADSEGTRAVEYLRRARKAEADVAHLMLAEEGAKEAFGHVVQQKRDLEEECIRLRSLLHGAYEINRRRDAYHAPGDLTRMSFYSASQENPRSLLWKSAKTLPGSVSKLRCTLAQTNAGVTGLAPEKGNK